MARLINDDASERDDRQFCFVKRFPRPRPDQTSTEIRHAKVLYQCSDQMQAETRGKLQLKRRDLERVTMELRWATRRTCSSDSYKKYVQYSLQEKVETSCSIEELDDIIGKLQNKLKHGSYKPSEEKHLFEEIKEAKLTRQDLIAQHAATNNPYSNQSYYQKEYMRQLKEDKKSRSELLEYRKSLAGIERDIRRLEKIMAALELQKSRALKLIPQPEE